METFLQSIAKHLYSKYGKNLGGQCLVFPNRRSGVFFRNYLRTLGSEGLWMPEIFTASSFMEKLSGSELADPIELSFMTYKVYRSLVKRPESYDEFYPWGEMMISDFDDIDKYLINARDLFTNVSDIKEIENHFEYLTEDQKELINRFWRYFENTDLSSAKQTFLEIWKLLFPVYEGLRKELHENGLAYEGLMYRKVAGRIELEDYPEISWQKVIVVGFNALNNAEKKLFKYLLKSGKGEFYWDYDQYYIESAIPEAGRFLRQNIADFPQSDLLDIRRDNLSGDKKITVFELPSDVLQTKILYQFLENRNPKELAEFNDTAIILGDESLLQAVLTSLPSNIPALNITMGYPVSATPVYSFVESLMKLQRNLSSRQKADSFYYRDVLSILNHQYLKLFSFRESDTIIDDINRNNRIYLKKSDFKDSGLFSLIFQKVEGAADMVVYLSSILSVFLPLMHEKDEPESEDLYALEKEYIFQIMTRLNKLKDIFSHGPEVLSNDGFSRLFRKILGNLRIPFEGEPLQGLQIMGILESRLLDFKNLVFLSLNEGVMPSAQRSFSFIPVNLRYGFGLPTHEEHDAIYAYYFYRLLQRAENVLILYNSKTEGLHTGEPGRYIQQLKYLFNYPIDFKTVSFRIAEKLPVEITIQKSSGIMEKLNAFGPEGNRYLSPSALSTYMDCPLRFYFNQIAEIREEEEANEEVDAPGFGQLYHHCMEKLYIDIAGKTVTEKLLDEICAPLNIQEKLDQAFREEFYHNPDPDFVVRPEGRNIIIYEIIRKLVVQTLQQDKKYTDFKFLRAEEKVMLLLDLPPDGISVRLGGKIDRIDERNGNIYLVDYKTGRASNSFKGVNHLFERDNWGNENFKAPFQVLMYSWLYSALFPEKIVVPSIYRTSELFSEDFNPFLEDKSRKSIVMNFLPYQREFEKKITSVIRDIFNPELAFTQTKDEKRCIHCPFAGICHRR